MYVFASVHSNALTDRDNGVVVATSIVVAPMMATRTVFAHVFFINTTMLSTVVNGRER